MKWSELTLKERKQIYDTVRADNPNATYFNIKEQFDNVPAYEDGGKKNPIPQALGRTPGTPEYYKRQQEISGRAESVQPEAYFTPAGYIKDAMNFVEDLTAGDYKGAALDAVANVLPWGTGKLVKKLKTGTKKAVGIANETAPKYSTNFVEPFTPTITTRKGKSRMSNVDAAEAKRKIQEARDLATGAKGKSDVIKQYDKEIGQVVWDAYNPADWYMMDRIKSNDKLFGTNYEQAYKQILRKDMTNRGEYVSWNLDKDGVSKSIGYADMPVNQNAYTDIKDFARKKLASGEYTPTVDDYVIKINPDAYVPGVANHELSHLADALETGNFRDNMNNKYMDWLLDYDNIMNPAEMQRRGLGRMPNDEFEYLTRPTEAKAHMINLRRGLLNKGKIGTYLQPVTKDMVENALNTNLLNNTTLSKQYNMYRNKDRFIQRMNNLNPMSLIPAGYLPFGLINEREE